MAEDLTDYLKDVGIQCTLFTLRYRHIERMHIFEIFAWVSLMS